MMCGLGAKQSLRPLPDLAIHECRMRAGMAKLPMPNLAEVDRVGQQFVERESRARPAHTGCSRICGPLASGESPRIADCLPERGRFEPPRPFRIRCAEFVPSLAHYSARKKASVLERTCSPEDS